MALSPKRLAFCREYIGNGGNATQAYIAAGYSKKGARQSAHTLLTCPDIADEIARRQARQEKVADVTVEEVLGLLREQAARGGTKATELLGRHIGMWGEGGQGADSWDTLAKEVADGT